MTAVSGERKRGVLSQSTPGYDETRVVGSAGIEVSGRAQLGGGDGQVINQHEPRGIKRERLDEPRLVIDISDEAHTEGD